MLRLLLILAVPGIILFSSLSDSGDSSKSSLVPVQVQDVASRAQLAGEKTSVQTVEKTEAVKVVPKPAPTKVAACGEDYYRNVNGNCVHRPSDNPSGASAQCRDGSYSYSQNRRGTCSGHGGVAEWY